MMNIMKGKVNRALALLLATVVVTASFGTMNVNAEEFATESLNNRANAETGVVSTSVNSSDATANLKVKLGVDNVTVDIYKLASVTWNSETNKYNDPVWVTEVSNWLKSSENHSDGNGNILSAFANPKNLSQASESTWDDFYYNLLSNEDSESGKLNVIDYGSSYTKNGENYENITGKLQKAVETKTVAEGGDKNPVFSLQIGIYAVIVKGSGRFKPVVTYIIPQENGPSGNYYLDNNYEVTLKASEATVDKKINNHDMDSVGYREVVDFTLDMTLPTLYSDRVTLTRAMDQQYSLYVTDVMSNAFTIYNVNGDKNESNIDIIDESDFTVKYKLNKSANLTTLENTKYDYYELCDSTYLAENSSLVLGTDYFNLSAETPAAPGALISGNTLYVKNVFTDITTQEAIDALGENVYAVKRSGKLYTLNYSVDETTKVTTITLSFNVHALKQLAMSLGGMSSLANATITLGYKGQVTDQILVKSEANTNSATITYEGGKDDDVVKAYTYALQVVKIDGSTAETVKPTYISGAEFSLYKEFSTYISKSGSVNGYEWYSSMEGQQADPLAGSLTLAQIRTDISTNGNDSSYYIYDIDVTDDNVGTFPAVMGLATGDKIARLFVKYTNGFYGANDTDPYDGQLISTATAEGITLKGLGEGNYVLVETKAPGGYNDLAEDILFEINRLSDDTAKLSYSGSLSTFLDMSDTPVESGVLTLKVLNYKGLTLPSTGGKGILMFTVLGMCLMMFAMVIIIAKQRKQSTDYYM